MTELVIRRLSAEELVGFVETAGTAFLDPAKDVAKVADELRALWDLDRTWGAFDGARMCGTFRSFVTEMTLPGATRVPAAAMSGVSVLPTHRRRGIMRAMVAAEHAAARDRGEAIGILYAAEYPIYGRFGYGPATQEGTWTLDARAATFIKPPMGKVEVVKPDETVRDGMKAVFEAWRLRTTGEIRRRDHSWDFDLALRPDHWGEDWKGFLALHRDDDGALDGYVRYSRAGDKWEQGQPRNAVKVDELHATTDQAYNTLWRFLAETDWVATVSAERRSPAERLPWLLVNGRDVRLSDVGDAVWVRLLDVGRALEARTYDRAASLVIEVADAEATGGRSRWHLETDDGGATCRATDRSPDLTLDVSALGAAYLGGVDLRDAVLTRGADEHRSGALAEAGRLLRTGDVPWCSTFF